MTMLTRFRTPERDLQTDAERIGDVRQHVRKALLSIEKEREGLTRRLENARARSASVLGNEYDADTQREPADEKLLVEAESQMVYAYARLGRLQSQQTMLAGMLGNLDEVEGEGPSSEDPLTGQPQPRASEPAQAPAWGRWICAAIGWALVLAIVFAALSGADQRPVASWLSADAQRFLAVFAAAGALCLAYPRSRALLFGAGLAAVVALGLGQVLVATLQAAFHDAGVRAAALAAALALVTWGGRFLPRPRAER